ncbi:MAG TPA: dihydropteroate synthase [Pontiella sp.]
MSTRKIYNWQCRDRILTLGERTLIMGILNITPDSFSDGGYFYDPSLAVEHALRMEAEGADMIDIGGESTRPGSEPVPAEEEIKRTIPVITRIRNLSNIPISIDTMKAEVARAAVEAGADIINDVSALEADNDMVNVVSETHAGVILMHMKGTPKTMQNSPAYKNVTREVQLYLKERISFAEQRGVARDAIVIDPGIGFGKTLEHNQELLRTLPALTEFGCGLLVGASRKRMIGQILGRDNPEERLAGSLGVAAWATMQGAHILRVHDVIETCDICRIMDTLLAGDI